jgi:transcriptional regulator with XRE-family HTH domain
MAAEDIKAWREKRGWSQQEMAAELGVDQATVSRIERGVSEPNGPVKRLLDRLMAEPATPAEAAE